MFSEYRFVEVSNSMTFRPPQIHSLFFPASDFEKNSKFSKPNHFYVVSNRVEVKRIFRFYRNMDEDIAARHLHTPVRGNVNGTDMLPFLCRKGYRIYLLGAAPQVAEEAGKKLLAEYPNCRIVGTQDGYFPESATDEIISRINQAGPDILLVAFGGPRQEFWIAKNLSYTFNIISS